MATTAVEHLRRVLELTLILREQIESGEDYWTTTTIENIEVEASAAITLLEAVAA